MKLEKSIKQQVENRVIKIMHIYYNNNCYETDCNQYENFNINEYILNDIEFNIIPNGKWINIKMFLNSAIHHYEYMVKLLSVPLEFMFIKNLKNIDLTKITLEDEDDDYE